MDVGKELDLYSEGNVWFWDGGKGERVNRMKKSITKN